jgi:hypothetical protein
MAFSLKMLAHSKTRLPQAFQGLLLQQYRHEEHQCIYHSFDPKEGKSLKC